MFNIKKRFFKRELKKIEAKIWNEEYARFLALIKREQTRQMIDQGKDALDKIMANPDHKKDDIKQVEDQLDKLKKEVDWFDTVLEGGTMGEGDQKMEDQGINQRIEQLVEKRELTKSFIKNHT